MKKITLNVKGMHCSSCEVLLKDILGDEAGVANAQISVAKGTAVVEFDENKITEDKIKDIIRKEGYGVK